MLGLVALILCIASEKQLSNDDLWGTTTDVAIEDESRRINTSIDVEWACQIDRCLDQL
jgi:hypothetical protein